MGVVYRPNKSKHKLKPFEAAFPIYTCWISNWTECLFFNVSVVDFYNLLTWESSCKFKVFYQWDSHLTSQQKYCLREGFFIAKNEAQEYKTLHRKQQIKIGWKKKNKYQCKFRGKREKAYQESCGTNLQAEGPILVFLECDKKTLHHLHYLQKTGHFLIKQWFNVTMVMGEVRGGCIPQIHILGVFLIWLHQACYRRNKISILINLGTLLSDSIWSMHGWI